MVFEATELAGLAGIAVAVVVIALIVTRLDSRIGDEPDGPVEDNDSSEPSPTPPPRVTGKKPRSKRRTQ